ncbi:MAG: hypothetical protein ACI4I8_07075 [Oscillospiraceae bacterium]
MESIIRHLLFACLFRRLPIVAVEIPIALSFRVSRGIHDRTETLLENGRLVTRQKGEADFQKPFSSIALFSALHNQSAPVTIHYFQEKSIEKIRLIVENTIKKKWSMKKGEAYVFWGIRFF